MGEALFLQGQSVIYNGVFRFSAIYEFLLRTNRCLLRTNLCLSHGLAVITTSKKSFSFPDFIQIQKSPLVRGKVDHWSDTAFGAHCGSIGPGFTPGAPRV